MHSANPGDAVTNYHTGQDCWVKIEFKNGDYIIRTRGKHNELTFCKEGEITSLSTLKNQQAFLNKQLGLDWEIFTSSSFFTQYGKSWLEMADTNRKKALERILHVDRFAFYSTSAKKSLDNINQSLAGSTQKISLHNSNIARLQATVNKQEINKNNYEETKASRVASIERSIITEQESLKSLTFPDLGKLEKTWSVYNQIAEKISEMEESIRTQSNLESGLTYKINDILDITVDDYLKLRVAEKFRERYPESKDTMTRYARANLYEQYLHFIKQWDEGIDNPIPMTPNPMATNTSRVPSIKELNGGGLPKYKRNYDRYKQKKGIY